MRPDDEKSREASAEAGLVMQYKTYLARQIQENLSMQNKAQLLEIVSLLRSTEQCEILADIYQIPRYSKEA